MVVLKKNILKPSIQNTEEITQMVEHRPTLCKPRV